MFLYVYYRLFAPSYYMPILCVRARLCVCGQQDKQKIRRHDVELKIDLSVTTMLAQQTAFAL